MSVSSLLFIHPVHLLILAWSVVTCYIQSHHPRELYPSCAQVNLLRPLGSPWLALVSDKPHRGEAAHSMKHQHSTVSPAVTIAAPQDSHLGWLPQVLTVTVGLSSLWIQPNTIIHLPIRYFNAVPHSYPDFILFLSLSCCLLEYLKGEKNLAWLIVPYYSPPWQQPQERACNS